MKKALLFLTAIAVSLSIGACSSEQSSTDVPTHEKTNQNFFESYRQRKEDKLLEEKYLEANDLFQTAIENFDVTSLIEVKTLFESLGNYKDSAEMVLECDYNIARNYSASGREMEAIEIFQSLGNYSDSQRMLAICYQSIACSALHYDDYETAKTYYALSGECYEDYAAIAKTSIRGIECLESGIANKIESKYNGQKMQLAFALSGLDVSTYYDAQSHEFFITMTLGSIYDFANTILGFGGYGNSSYDGYSDMLGEEGMLEYAAQAYALFFVEGYEDVSCTCTVYDYNGNWLGSYTADLDYYKDSLREMNTESSLTELFELEAKYPSEDPDSKSKLLIDMENLNKLKEKAAEKERQKAEFIATMNENDEFIVAAAECINLDNLLDNANVFWINNGDYDYRDFTYIDLYFTDNIHTEDAYVDASIDTDRAFEHNYSEDDTIFFVHIPCTAILDGYEFYSDITGVPDIQIEVQCEFILEVILSDTLTVYSQYNTPEILSATRLS